MADFENKKILIIDDDTRIHGDFRKILENKAEMSEYDEIEARLFSSRAGEMTDVSFELDSAYQGQEGFEKVKASLKEGRPYAVAFIDMRMPPGWDGLETIKHIWEVDRDIQLVICTAYSDYSWSEVLYHLGMSDRLIILKKPFDMVEVQQLATALTTKWNLGRESMMRLRQIEESEEKYRTVVNSVDDTIMTMDREGNVLFVNHNQWKLPVKATKEGNYYSGIKEEFRKNVIETVNEVIDTGRQKSVEFAIEGRDGRTIWSEGRISPYYKDNKIVAATLVASDITARKALDWQLTHDELTGLANRGYFSARVDSCLKENPSNNKFAIIFIDIDHFNLINDCFGHDLGDKVLIEVSNILQRYTNEGELLARLGGDEFAMLKCLHGNRGGVSVFVDTIFETLKQPMNVDGFDIYPSASIGIVVADNETDTSISLMRDADAALYHAKSSGRGRYEYFDEEVRKNIVNRMSLGNELRRAIDKNEFELYYQPLIDVGQKKVSGFEALIRWNHPERGQILPEKFMPIAEETGLIVPLTRKVLEMVSRQARRWGEIGYGEIKIAVNISAREFNEQNLKDIVQEICKQEGDVISQLEIELTESSIMDDVESSIKNMGMLSDMGLTISIDDFGTGYSSFSYIKQFAIDKLKIDRAFIKDTPADEDDVAIVEAIIAMAKRLKIKVVAEGVETQEQVDFLLKANCDYLQGYFMGRPMPEEVATERLIANNWPLQTLFTVD